MAGFWTFYALAVPPLPASSTAWQDGSFHIDVPGVLHRSDIFLGLSQHPGPQGRCRTIPKETLMSSIWSKVQKRLLKVPPVRLSHSSSTTQNHSSRLRP
jgi:hypothetical protein